MERIFCWMQWRCPLCVARISVRYLEMLAVVSRGQEERNPALMAAKSVALVGEKKAACMNCMAFWRHFLAWTIVIALSFCCCWSAWSWAIIVWVSRYLWPLLCYIPCNTTVPLQKITTSFFVKVTVHPASHKCPIESME